MYEVNQETIKYAPAALCSIGARIIAMRKVFEKSPPQIQRILAPFIGPIAFEKELLSGNKEQHDFATIEIGKLYNLGKAQREAEMMQLEAEMQIAEMLSNRALDKLEETRKKLQKLKEKA